MMIWMGLLAAQAETYKIWPQYEAHPAHSPDGVTLTIAVESVESRRNHHEIRAVLTHEGEGMLVVQRDDLRCGAHPANPSGPREIQLRPGEPVQLTLKCERAADHTKIAVERLYSRSDGWCGTGRARAIDTLLFEDLVWVIEETTQAL